MRRLLSSICALAACLAVAACGSSTSGTGTGSGGSSTAPTGGSPVTATTPKPASLMLDFTPNAIHSGIYMAMARHYDRAHGVALHVQVPGNSTDAVKLLDAGKVDFAILDIHDLAIADAQGRGLVGIMAIVERPLASVIAQPQYASPKALAGQTVGVTGAPSDTAVLRSIVAGAGGNPAQVKTITIGYNAVPDLLSGKVAAATAFWNDEGVQLAHARPGFHVFRVEDYGAPAYPELVVCTTRAELKRDRKLAGGLVAALTEGYRAVLADPSAAVRVLTSQVTGLNATAVRRQLNAELPAFKPAGGGPVGALEPTLLRRWARWEAQFGIVKRRPDVTTMFDPSLVGG